MISPDLIKNGVRCDLFLTPDIRILPGYKFFDVLEFIKGTPENFLAEIIKSYDLRAITKGFILPYATLSSPFSEESDKFWGVIGIADKSCEVFAILAASFATDC